MHKEKKRKSLKQRLEQVEKALSSQMEANVKLVHDMGDLKTLLKNSIQLCSRCSQIPTIYEGNGNIKVTCSSCGSFSRPDEGWFTTLQEAVKFWNDNVELRSRIRT